VHDGEIWYNIRRYPENGVCVMRNETEARYLSRRDAAGYLGVSVRSLDTWTAAGRVVASKMGKRVLYDRIDLDRAVAAGKQPAA